MNFVNVARNPKYDDLWKLTFHDTIECPVYSCRDTADIQEFFSNMENLEYFGKLNIYDSPNGISYVPKYMLIQKYVLFEYIWRHLNFREP